MLGGLGRFTVQRSREETMPRIDDRIALPDGRWLAYTEFGDPDGRPVLLFHGTPGYRHNPWTTDAELRSAGVRLIVPDRPGVGRSTPRFSNGGPHAAACVHKLSPRVTGTALVAPMPPLDQPGAVRQLGAPAWYYPLARRAPWALRALYAGLAALARRNPRRAERLLLGGMSQADQRLFARAELAGRFGADLAGAGSRGVVTDERLMPLPWGFTPEQVKGPVHLWLGEHDQLVPPRVWLQQPNGFPDCQTTVVPDAGHFLIAEHMTTILDNL